MAQWCGADNAHLAAFGHGSGIPKRKGSSMRMITLLLSFIIWAIIVGTFARLSWWAFTLWGPV